MRRSIRMPRGVYQLPISPTEPPLSPNKSFTFILCEKAEGPLSCLTLKPTVNGKAKRVRVTHTHLGFRSRRYTPLDVALGLKPRSTHSSPCTCPSVCSLSRKGFKQARPPNRQVTPLWHILQGGSGNSCFSRYIL